MADKMNSLPGCLKRKAFYESGYIMVFVTEILCRYSVNNSQGIEVVHAGSVKSLLVICKIIIYAVAFNFKVN